MSVVPLPQSDMSGIGPNIGFGVEVFPGDHGLIVGEPSRRISHCACCPGVGGPNVPNEQSNFIIPPLQIRAETMFPLVALMGCCPSATSPHDPPVV